MRPGFPGGLTFEAVPDPEPNPGFGIREPEPDYAPPAPEPVEPAWAGPPQEEWEQYRQQQDYLLSRLEQLAQMGQPQDPNALEIPEGSTLLPEDLQVVEQLMQRYMAPLMETREQWMQNEGDQRAHDIIADDVTANGDFLLEGSKDKARALSETLYGQYAQRYGPGAQAAEAAIRDACAQTREWERQVGEAYYERQTNQLRTLHNAPQIPSAAVPAGVQTHITAPAGDERAAVRKYFQG